MTYEINLNLFIYSYSFFLNINNIIFIGISRATKDKSGSSKSPLEVNDFNIFGAPMFMTNTLTQVDIIFLLIFIIISYLFITMDENLYV
jgi:hypothetical protein